MMRKGFRRIEQGATLIVVLFLLLAITILGVMGIRVAMTSLNISTNAQVVQLLGQSADAPLNFVATTDLSGIADLSGVIGFAIEDSKNSPGNEYVFCYRPTSSEKFGASLNLTVLEPPAKNDPVKTKATVSSDFGGAGFCNLEEDFGSAREATVTQIAVKVPIDPLSNDASPGALLSRGTNLSAGTLMPKNLVEQQRIRVTTTAIMPAFARVDLDEIQRECIGSFSTGGYINDNSDEDLANKYTVAQCLSDHGVPVSSQTQEFNLQTIFVEKVAP